MIVYIDKVRPVDDWGAIAFHPQKGSCIFATRDILKGEILMQVKLKDLCLKKHRTLDTFKKSLEGCSVNTIQKILEHSVPAIDGTVMQPYSDHPHCYFNHSRPCNCRHYNDYYTKTKFQTIALIDIPKNHELTIDYDHSSGYEARYSEPLVQQYIEMCIKYGVEKRPSRLTLPPAIFLIKG